jgi:perosamine synthetase
MKKIDRVSALERKYVNEVLDGGFASASSYQFVTRLEQKFAELFNVKHAVAMVNGTATLHMALEAAGVEAGDEVICPPLTMSSTAITVLHANAVPVFADVDRYTFNLDANDFREKITSRTKAVIPVALYGLMPDIQAIKHVADEFGIAVIEDNAESFLPFSVRDQKQLGHIASYSFQSSKHITAGEGGIAATDDDDLALKLRRYSGLGYAGIDAEKGRITKDDIQSPDYARHTVLGFNYRMADLCGAVILAQIERFFELLDMRRIAAEYLLSAMDGHPWLRPQKVPKGEIHSYWTVAAILEHPDVEWKRFREKFIELGGDRYYAAWMLTYKEPVFQEKAFLNREKHPQFDHVNYENVYCSAAEYLQPKLIQFKTNYWNEEDAKRQSEILKKTLCFFESE